MSSSEPPNREIVFVFVSCVRARVRAGGRAGDQGVDVRSDSREKSDPRRHLSLFLFWPGRSSLFPGVDFHAFDASGGLEVKYW